MAAPVVNLSIDQHTDFSATFTIRKSDGSVVDLRGYDIESKLRKWSQAANVVSMGTTFGTNGALGKITVSLGSTQTGILTAGRYNYDIVITNQISSLKSKVIQGQVIVSDTMTN